MPNTNVLKGIVCPQCGSEGPFDIEGTAMFLDVTDDGTTDYADVEWTYDSTIVCKNCKETGEVRGFTKVKKTIVATNVDVSLLRDQRNYLLTIEQTDEIKGLVNLLDDMLDYAEGYK